MRNKNLENPSNDVLLFEHCAAVMALCLRANSQHQPCHQHLLLCNRKHHQKKNPADAKKPQPENCHSFCFFHNFRNTCFLGFSFILIEPRRGDDGGAGFV